MKIEGRSIFGYFADRNDAEQAKERLVAAGFEDTQLDSVRHDRGGDYRPLTGGIDSLSNLVLGSDVESDDAGILLAANPSASGFASGDAGVREKAWLVVTVTDGSDEEVERAVQIVKHYGGDV